MALSDRPARVPAPMTPTRRRGSWASSVATLLDAQRHNDAISGHAGCRAAGGLSDAHPCGRLLPATPAKVAVIAPDR